ncbi:MAG: sigma 54-interacting transcriptional regulator [Paracoccus sp. (in: a-proteobacteria)]|uniref:sigma-54-dependent Fis family transcriptional regulator n=1 Tax=Paracoccus sp. TaxID=267 RepID=UPI0026DEFD5D|nr:sigma 54-interacting transcriptional regulator [Paracoccus sp. (in: a-proteobacteria)]MDO5633232.1 sigma 54-interacting transcriptional regulator [Paracoccus sp. (in: a-proteobacteria)]
MGLNITKRDWEDFVGLGKVPSRIREDVLASWRRSDQAGVANPSRAPLRSEAELLTARAVARRLRKGADNALARANYLLAHTGNIVLLCDRSGVVLDAGGDSGILAMGRENHLHLGGDWTEQAIGTNAIGTALHLRRPVTIHSVEHFCEAIQRWNCAATPITDPGTGALLGVVDISWLDHLAQPNAAALSAALAAQVESDLTRMLAQEHETLIERLHLRRLRRGNEPMLMMDRAGNDVFATEGFQRFCDDDTALSALRARIPDLIDQPSDTIAEALGECMPGTDLEVIGSPDEAIGVMISLRRRRAARPDPGAELIRIGQAGPVSAALCAQAERLARTAIPLLIEGESGVGKTFLAQAIHRASPQAQGPFEMIDCSILTAATLREDLAHGARLTCDGAGGVLCLNGPGSVSDEVQKLLLSLVEMTIQGGSRIIALSSRPLYAAMQAGEFRSDLYHRIAAARLNIPPLHERPEEIAATLKMMTRHHADTTGGRNLNFTSGAMAALQAYRWPGNLREMANLIAALDALSSTGLIDVQTLPPEIRTPVRQRPVDTLRDGERLRILEAMDAEGGNLSRTAKRLGIARSTLYMKLDSYDIPRHQRD